MYSGSQLQEFNDNYCFARNLIGTSVSSSSSSLFRSRVQTFLIEFRSALRKSGTRYAGVFPQPPPPSPRISRSIRRHFVKRSICRLGRAADLFQCAPRRRMERERERQKEREGRASIEFGEECVYACVYARGFFDRGNELNIALRRELGGIYIVRCLTR